MTNHTGAIFIILRRNVGEHFPCLAWYMPHVCTLIYASQVFHIIYSNARKYRIELLFYRLIEYMFEHVCVCVWFVRFLCCI